MILSLLDDLRDVIFNYCEIFDLINLACCSRDSYSVLKDRLWDCLEIPFGHLLMYNLGQKAHVRKKENLQFTKQIVFTEEGFEWYLWSKMENKMASSYLTILKSCINLQGIHTSFYLPKSVLKVICKMNNLVELDMEGSKITDSDLLLVCKDLSGLLKLNIRRTGVTSDAMVHLRNLTLLQELIPIHESLNDLGVEHICCLPLLRRLELAACSTVTVCALPLLSNVITLRELVLCSTRILDSGASQISKLKNLQKLDLNNTSIADADLSFVSQISTLISLVICRTNISDDGLKYISSLSLLQDLDIGETHITHVGIEYLTPLSSLQRLRCWNTGIQDFVGPSLQKFNLLSLDLSRCLQMTKVGFSFIGNLSHLEKLNLSGLKFQLTKGIVADKFLPLTRLRELVLAEADLNDEDFSCIGTHVSLVKLNISFTGLSNEGMRLLCNLKSLTDLNCSRNGDVTDVGLSYLYHLTSLQYLIIGGTSINDAKLLDFVKSKDSLRSVKYCHLNQTLHAKRGFHPLKILF